MCTHPLCALIGGVCSLAVHRSRGGRPGRYAPDVAPAVLAEVRTLLDAIDASTEGAPARLAKLVRTEALEERNLLAQARDDDPDLADRLARLIARR